VHAGVTRVIDPPFARSVRTAAGERSARQRQTRTMKRGRSMSVPQSEGSCQRSLGANTFCYQRKAAGDRVPHANTRIQVMTLAIINSQRNPVRC
jgi:hypothetical protein